MTADRPLLGIGLMLGFCFLAPLSDAVAKTLGTSVSLGVLLATRFALQVAFLAPFTRRGEHKFNLSGLLLSLILMRTVFHIFGIGSMFMALRYLPLADAVAIAFVMPLILLLLGKTVLHETVGPHRLAACSVGFAGTLLVIQPNFAHVGAPALLPLLVALIFAAFILTTRKIAKQIDAVSLQFVSGIFACVILTPLLAFAPANWTELQLEMPTRGEGVLLFFMGILGTVAHLLMTWSLRFAPSTTLAPMQYFEIPFATLIGWVVFHDLPNGLAAAGIAITILSGLYVIWRERLIVQQTPVQPPQAPIAEA